MKGKRPMDETIAVSRRVSLAYDDIAAPYAIRNAVMPPALIDLGQRLLHRTGLSARVLDVGCGVGRDMAWLEAHGAEVVGVDLSVGMLAEARTRARGALVRMDMRNLAFANGRFHGVWCVASLLHLPKSDAPRVLTELRRVLLPGGTIVLSLQEGIGEAWEPDPYGKGTTRYFARYLPSEATDLLTDAGFAVISQSSEAVGTRHWLSFLGMTDDAEASRDQ